MRGNRRLTEEELEKINLGDTIRRRSALKKKIEGALYNIGLVIVGSVVAGLILRYLL